MILIGLWIIILFTLRKENEHEKLEKQKTQGEQVQTCSLFF